MSDLAGIAALALLALPARAIPALARMCHKGYVRLPSRAGSGG